MNTAKTLEKLCRYHSHLYYCCGTSEISDYAFDCIERAFQYVDPGNDYFNQVGAGKCGRKECKGKGELHVRN